MHSDNQLIRRAFGSFMTGVTVVTTTDNNGNPIGFTANSFTSVSIEPPLLLVCPGNHLQSFDIFNSATHFGVNVLAEGQEAVSNTFASGAEDRFAKVAWYKDANGTPILEDVCASFSCRVHQRHMAGDHMVLIGEVLHFEHTERGGLGYGSNGYFSLSYEQQAEASTDNHITGIAGAIIKYKDQVLVIKNEHGLTLPTIEQHGTTGARSALQEYIDSNAPDISLGPVYSIYDDTQARKRYTFFLANTTSTNNVMGEFLPIDTLDTSTFYDTAQATMMARFKTEEHSNVFGLYIGDTESGDIHHQPNPLSTEQV